MVGPALEAAPTTFVVTLAELLAWKSSAKPGDRLVYAAGWPRGLGETGKKARALADAGLVRMHLVRDHDAPAWVLIRTDARGGAASPPPRARGEIALGSDEQERLLKALKRAAALGIACPSNARLAEVASLRDRDQAAYFLSRLAKLGAVTVETRRIEGVETRVVTIAETGRSTKRPEAVR